MSVYKFGSDIESDLAPSIESVGRSQVNLDTLNIFNFQNFRPEMSPDTAYQTSLCFADTLKYLQNLGGLLDQLMAHTLHAP